MLGQLGRMSGAGALWEAGDPVPNAVVAATDTLRPGLTWFYAAVLLTALALSAWRGPRYLAVLAGSALLLFPAVNRSYLNFYDTRYLGYLLPLAYAAVGVQAAPGLAAGRRGRVALALGLGVLIAYPLLSLSAYYQREAAAGRTNAPLIAAADHVAAHARAPGHHVLVDKALRPIKMGGGGDPTAAFDQLLTLRRVPHELADAAKMRWFLGADPGLSLWLLAAEDTAAALGAEFPLRTRARGEGWRLVVRQGARTNSP
jgi:hypothetical protein